MKRLSFLLLSFFVILAAYSQKTNVRDYVSIHFAPNHSDWTYRVGERVTIDVSVVRHYLPVPDTDISLQWGMEQHDSEQQWTISTGRSGVKQIVVSGSLVPGFKTLVATATIDGKSYTNTITLGFDPHLLQPTTPLPADFDAFWQSSIREARKHPLKPLFTLLPDRCTPDADVYEVRFQNFKEGHYLYGTLAVPQGVDPLHCTERYPTLILWPGAGVKPHPGDLDFFPAHGVITLEMGINGIPVNLAQQVYTDLRANALHDYNTIHLDDKDRYYYRRVYAGTVKTVDFLCSLPCVDTTRIGCYGGSQGGALSIVNAALDSRIKVVAASYPALSEIAGYVRGRVAGWPQWKTLSDDKVAVTDYYDVVNFARRLTCPVWFMLGYNDQVCRPTTTYTVYNAITAPKSLLLPLDCAHWMYTEHKQLRAKWLLDALTK